jgi:hypothetical protein
MCWKPSRQAIRTRENGAVPVRIYDVFFGSGSGLEFLREPTSGARPMA